MAARKFILEHKRALGDTVLLTALVRDLSITQGDRIQLDIRTYNDIIWRHNPYLTKLQPRDEHVTFLGKLDYTSQLQQSWQGLYRKHFLTSLYDEFSKRTGIKVEPLHPKADLHLSDEERTVPLVSGRYWVVMAGCRKDITVKQWEYDKYQQVVNELRVRGLRFVQAGSSSDKGVQPTLQNVLNLVGKTNERDFIRLIYHAEGVLCPITSAMHIAAWADKPCVVVAGGREETWWEHYTNEGETFGPIASGKLAVPHKFLHTIDLLQCCKGKGCGLSNVLGQTPQDRKACRQPLILPSKQPVAKCMDMIGVEDVVTAILSYYEDGILPPPIQTGKKLILLSGLSAPAIPVAIPEPELVATPEHLQKPLTPRLPPPIDVAANVPEEAIYDHPTIGGKLTIFVLCYGDYADLAQQCIDGILKTVPLQRMDLRIGLNAVGEETMEYLAHLPIKPLLYAHPENALKYPLMREMFWDKKHPITTNHLIWFDDDSYPVRPDWCKSLCRVIVDGHHKGERLYGMTMYHAIKGAARPGYPDPKRWFTQARWYRGKLFRNRLAKPAPNGNLIFFSHGAFWAMGVDAMRACDIPDIRLGLSGGDITIGEQMWQGGFKLREFNTSKAFVRASGAPPRGLSPSTPQVKKMPWYELLVPQKAGR